MKYFSLSGFFFVCLFFFSSALIAQITVTTDHADGNYSVGQTVHFQIHSTVSTSATYTINRGKYTNALLTGTVQLNAGATSVVSFPGSEPENLHFSVSNGWAGGIATAMIGADDLVPFESEPSDFDGFWNGVKAQLAGVPMNPQVVPYNSTTYSSSFTVSLGNIDGRQVYGMLTVPKGQGPFPVVLEMPAYGSFPISPLTQFAERANAITLSITIHNAPATQTDPNAYSPNDPSDRNLLYHKHSVTAGIRAIDYLTSRPDFNGTDVVVSGVSQGAGLGLLVAGLDSRVKLLTIGTPTMASHAGMLHEHPSGFPFYLRVPIQTNDPAQIAAVLQATKYYEAASAAKRYHGNVFLLTSYNDQVTIPETQFIASNLFSGKKVILHNIPGNHDNRPTEYLFGRFEYLRRYFSVSNNPPFPWSSTAKGYIADAGQDQAASTGIPLSLVGEIINNSDIINPNIPVTWRKISGPGTVSFSSGNAYNTSATFSQNGTYVLEFRGKDTGLLSSKKLFYSVSDRVVITVGDGSGDPAPTVVLSAPTTSVSSSFVVTANFSESISGLALSDFTVTNGSLSNLSGSGSNYTFTVHPSSVGAVTIQLPSGKVVDSSNQGNTESNLLTVQYSVSQDQEIDLSLSLTADITTAPLYSPINFSLEIANTSQASAHNVQVMCKLPQGFGLLSSNPSTGSYNSWTGEWTLGALAAGATATVNITANLNQEAPPVFYAQVTAAQEEDVDSSPNNNAGPVPSEDDEAAITITTSGGGGDTNPTVVLSTASTTVSGAFVVTVQFNETVTGLTQNDFVINNGSANGLAGSGDTYNLSVAPNATNITIQLPANKVVAGSGLGNEVSNILIVQYNPPSTGSYCKPGGIPWHEWIARVQFGGINKQSGKDGYADYTSLSTNVTNGADQNITIDLGHGYWIYDQNYAVWIDFNQDNDFDDSGELVFERYVPAADNGTNPPSIVGSIHIPNTALTGQTRMRVALSRNSQPGPCDNIDFGEYEDYSVNVQGGVVNPPGTYCASNSTPWNDWISRVQVGSINKSSGKEGYADFTNLETDLPKGQSSSITIALGHGYWIYNEYYRVWIDLNQDGDFEDANELLVSKLVPSIGNGLNPIPLIAEMNIPNSAMLGKTRLRVSLHRDSYGNSCNQGGFGEVEDYSINIVEDDNGGGQSGDYCTSQATPWNDWIARVQFGAIDHSSSKEGYADFTAFSTGAQKGVELPITISLGHGYWIYNQFYDVWIDLNQDGDFSDSGELLMSMGVLATPHGSAPSPLVGSLTIPNSALNGTTRMRVSMRRGLKPSNPCEQGGYGETEDYTVNIQNYDGLVSQSHLLDFTAQEFMSGVKTNWAVDNASTMQYFVLERATGGDFKSLQMFEYEAGNTSFDYWDPNPVIGMNYYRLKIVEQNNYVHYSEIREIEYLEPNSTSGIVRLFPTISYGSFKINLADYQSLAAKIEIIDASGRVVRQWEYDSLDGGILKYNEFELKQGMYFVSIRIDGQNPIIEKLMIRE